MQLVSSELIFPSRFLPWGAGTLRLIGRIACMTEGGASDRPRTLIFRVLRWHDRSEILKGARQAYPVKCAQDNVTLLFFPDFSPATTIRRKAFNPVLKKMTALGLQPFLIYPAVINYDTKGNRWVSTLHRKRRILSAPVPAEDVCRGSTGRQRENSGHYLSGPTGEAWWPGRDDDRMDMKAWTCLLLFLLSFLLLGYCPYLSGTTISLLVRLTPLFFFFGWD